MTDNTVSRSRAKLEDHFCRWSGAGVLREEREAIDELIAAIRAETLAPATRGQSAELSEAESRLRAWNEMMHPQMGEERTEANILSHDVHAVLDIVDRLRAALAAASASLSDVRSCFANHQEATARLRESHAGLEAENAELRKLCGRAAINLDNATQLVVDEFDADPEDVEESRAFVAELEAAAGRAGK